MRARSGYELKRKWPFATTLSGKSGKQTVTTSPSAIAGMPTIMNNHCQEWYPKSPSRPLATPYAINPDEKPAIGVARYTKPRYCNLADALRVSSLSELTGDESMLIRTVPQAEVNERQRACCFSYPQKRPQDHQAWVSAAKRNKRSTQAEQRECSTKHILCWKGSHE